MDSLQTTRRNFLKTSAGSALLIGFALPLSLKRAQAQTNTFAPNAWLRITPDNRITVISGSAEMGQGVLTALALGVFEHLSDSRLTDVNNGTTAKVLRRDLWIHRRPPFWFDFLRLRRRVP